MKGYSVSSHIQRKKVGTSYFLVDPTNLHVRVLRLARFPLHRPHGKAFEMDVGGLLHKDSLVEMGLL